MLQRIAYVIIFLAYILPCFDCSCSICHENATCTSYRSFLQFCSCNDGFYGNGFECYQCSGNVDCNCDSGFEWDDNIGVCVQVCTALEGFQFAGTLVDTGSLSGAGCDMIFLGNNQPCCDLLVELFRHECLSLAMDLGTVSNSTSAALSYLIAAQGSCGAALKVGYLPRDDCGNGVLDGWEDWEKCDDGNLVSGDGCSECWIDEGYSCHVNATGTSVCRMCSSDCSAAHRHQCDAPLGPCGECLDGFEEVDGRCGKLFHMYYVGLTPEAYDRPQQCVFREVGWVAEPDELPGADRFLNFLRSKMPHRTMPSEICGFYGATMQYPGLGPDAVIVMEAFSRMEEHHANIGKLYQNVSTFVLFSEGPTPTVIDSMGTQLFDVYSGLTFIMQNMLLRNASFFEGGVFRGYGARIVMENVIVEGVKSRQFVSDGGMEFRCVSEMFSISGALSLRDVVIRDSNLDGTRNADRRCAHHDPGVVTVYGQTYMQNVTFSNVLGLGDLLYISGAQPSYLKDVSFYGNTILDGALVLSESQLEISGLRASGNYATGGAVLSLRGMAPVHLNDFYIAGNTAADGAGIIYNTGVSSLRNGVFEENTMLLQSSVIVNRAYLDVYNVSIVSNDGSALDTSLWASLSDCNVHSNKGSPTYHAIRSSGALFIVNSTFDAMSPEVISIETRDPFILRDSLLPIQEGVLVADCDTKLSASYSPQLSACGIRATCSQASGGMQGVHCECPSYGDPTVLCGRLATLYLLPSNTVNMYTTKPAEATASYHTETHTLVLAEGLGTLMWHVVPSSLPFWLAVDPSQGSMLLSGLCPEGVDATLTFDAERVTGNARILEAEVVFAATASYLDPYAGNVTDTVFVPLRVHYEVDVLPSSFTSAAAYLDPCFDIGAGADCAARSGSTVLISVALRDSTNASIGIGGHNLDVSSSSILTISSVDHHNGTYSLELEAPKTHFYVNVKLWGEHIVGSPLYFRVRCSTGEKWSEEKNQCEKYKFSLQDHKYQIAGLLVLLTLAGGALIRFFQGRGFHLELAVMEKESYVLLGSCTMELVDILSDVGAVWSISTDSSLSVYRPWYLAALTVSVPVSCISILKRVAMMRTVLREKSVSSTSYGIPTCPRPPHRSTSARSSQFEVVRESDADVVTDPSVAASLRRLHRKTTGCLLLLLSLCAEDIPMQILNTVVLTTNDRIPPPVLVSTALSCCLIGLKISRITEYRRFSYKISRLETKLLDQRRN
eukprot:Rmarinus@m.25556